MDSITHYLNFPSCCCKQHSLVLTSEVSVTTGTPNLGVGKPRQAKVSSSQHPSDLVIGSSRLLIFPYRVFDMLNICGRCCWVEIQSSLTVVSLSLSSSLMTAFTVPLFCLAGYVLMEVLTVVVVLLPLVFSFSKRAVLERLANVGLFFFGDLIVLLPSSVVFYATCVTHMPHLL